MKDALVARSLPPKHSVNGLLLYVLPKAIENVFNACCKKAERRRDSDTDYRPKGARAPSDPAGYVFVGNDNGIGRCYTC